MLSKRKRAKPIKFGSWPRRGQFLVKKNEYIFYLGMSQLLIDQFSVFIGLKELALAEYVKTVFNSKYKYRKSVVVAHARQK